MELSKYSIGSPVNKCGPSQCRSHELQKRGQTEVHNLKRAAANRGAGSDYRPSAFDVNKQLLLRLLSN